MAADVISTFFTKPATITALKTGHWKALEVVIEQRNSMALVVGPSAASSASSLLLAARAAASAAAFRACVRRSTGPVHVWQEQQQQQRRGVVACAALTAPPRALHRCCCCCCCCCCCSGAVAAAAAPTPARLAPRRRRRFSSACAAAAPAGSDPLSTAAAATPDTASAAPTAGAALAADVVVTNEAGMARLAAALAADVKAGDAYMLYGAVGAGKSAFRCVLCIPLLRCALCATSTATPHPPLAFLDPNLHSHTPRLPSMLQPRTQQPRVHPRRRRRPAPDRAVADVPAAADLRGPRRRRIWIWTAADPPL